MNKSVILLSGGLDSLISLCLKKEKLNITLGLTFDYGQRASEKEIEASRAIAKHFGIEHKVIKLDLLKEITQTALVNKNKQLPDLDELDSFEKAIKSAKAVWVPNRNGLFLNIAASYADSYEFTHIVFGANKEEGTTFPDNTQEFIDCINSSLSFSTLQKPIVTAPLIELTKNEIIAQGIKNNAPFNLIRSCYNNENKHCGNCESCKRLKRALKENNADELIKELFG